MSLGLLWQVTGCALAPVARESAAPKQSASDGAPVASHQSRQAIDAPPISIESVDLSTTPATAQARFADPFSRHGLLVDEGLAYAGIDVYLMHPRPGLIAVTVLGGPVRVALRGGASLLDVPSEMSVDAGVQVQTFLLPAGVTPTALVVTYTLGTPGP